MQWTQFLSSNFSPLYGMASVWFFIIYQTKFVYVNKGINSKKPSHKRPQKAAIWTRFVINITVAILFKWNSPLISHQVHSKSTCSCHWLAYLFQTLVYFTTVLIYFEHLPKCNLTKNVTVSQNLYSQSTWKMKKKIKFLYSLWWV